MELIPLFDRVVVRALPIKQEKLGSIILPEIAKQPEISEVIALGIGKLEGEEVKFQVKLGDKVIFNKFNGNEFKINNENYVIIKEKDILAIIKE